MRRLLEGAIGLMHLELKYVSHKCVEKSDDEKNMADRVAYLHRDNVDGCSIKQPA